MDDFRTYLKDIKGFPDFREDPTGTSALVARMTAGDRGAAAALIESTLRFIAELAAAHCYRWRAWQNQRDLVQEANVEVVAKISRYDSTKASLKEFINHRAHVAFIRFWHKSSVVQVTDYGRKIAKNLQRAHSQLALTLNREPSLEELCEHVGRKEAEVAVTLSSPRVAIFGISEQGEDKLGGAVINLDSLTSVAVDPYQNIEADEFRELLVKCLGKRDAELLLTYYDLGSDEFRHLYFQTHGKRLTANAARKAKQRLQEKLTNHPLVKDRRFNRGEDQ